jgi:hypothetical protein
MPDPDPTPDDQRLLPDGGFGTGATAPDDGQPHDVDDPESPAIGVVDPDATDPPEPNEPA